MVWRFSVVESYMVTSVVEAPSRRRSPNLLGILMGNDAGPTRLSPDGAGWHYDVSAAQSLFLRLALI